MGYPTFRYRNFREVLRAPAFVTGQWRQGQQGEFGPRGLGTTVINKSGSDIAADQLVAISGFDTTSRLPQIVLANAGTAGLLDVYVTPAVIHNGKSGIVYKGGLSGKTLNTNAAAAGSAVYVDVNSGGFTTTAPAASTSRKHIAGYIITQSATVGQVLWDIQSVTGFSNSELNPQTVQFSKVNIPIATFAAAHATPASVLAAPGAGNIIMITDAAVAYNYDGSHALTGGGTVNLVYHGGSVSPHASNIAAGEFTGSASTFNVLPPITSTLELQGGTNAFTNTGIDISVATANFTVNSSTGSVDVLVWYTVVQL